MHPEKSGPAEPRCGATGPTSVSKGQMLGSVLRWIGAEGAEAGALGAAFAVFLAIALTAKMF